jgi:hypothetical protein
MGTGLTSFEHGCGDSQQPTQTVSPILATRPIPCPLSSVELSMSCLPLVSGFSTWPSTRPCRVANSRNSTPTTPTRRRPVTRDTSVRSRRRPFHHGSSGAPQRALSGIDVDQRVVNVERGLAVDEHVEGDDHRSSGSGRESLDLAALYANGRIALARAAVTEDGPYEMPMSSTRGARSLNAVVGCPWRTGSRSACGRGGLCERAHP